MDLPVRADIPGKIRPVTGCPAAARQEDQVDVGVIEKQVEFSRHIEVVFFPEFRIDSVIDGQQDRHEG